MICILLIMCLCSIASGETVSSHGATRENIVTVTQSSTSFYITSASSNTSSIRTTKTTHSYGSTVYYPSSSKATDQFILLAMTIEGRNSSNIAVYYNGSFSYNIEISSRSLTRCNGVTIRELEDSTNTEIYCSYSGYLFIGANNFNETRFIYSNEYSISSSNCADMIEADHNIIAIS